MPSQSKESAISGEVITCSIARPMKESEFRRFSRFIHSECGIKMPPTKRTMLQARIQKRLRALGMTSFTEYCDYVFGPEGRGEVVNMIDVVTTNKTDFFREPAHFDFMVDSALPELINTYGAGLTKPLRVWSAGCSTGEEPYTLGMVLSSYAENCEGFSYRLMATDISTRVLEHAMRGIYDERVVEPVPMAMRKKFLLRSKDRGSRRVRIRSVLRSAVSFKRLNLMDKSYGMREKVDIIFCRNVIIYFDQPTQETLLKKLCGCLRDGGYIFMGHSETLSGHKVPLRAVATTVYRKS